MIETSARFINRRHKKLFELIKENRCLLFFGMICSMVVAASTSATAWLMKHAIDEVDIRNASIKSIREQIAILVLDEATSSLDSESEL